MRVVGQDKSDHRQRQNDGQESIGAPEVVVLLVVAQRADQQCEPDHAVQIDGITRLSTR